MIPFRRPLVFASRTAARPMFCHEERYKNQILRWELPTSLQSSKIPRNLSQFTSALTVKAFVSRFWSCPSFQVHVRLVLSFTPHRFAQSLRPSDHPHSQPDSHRGHCS